MPFLAAQEAEERKKQAEEKAAADAKAEAEAKDPVLQLRKAAASGSPEAVVKRLGELAPEGGAAVRMRVLYEVWALDWLGSGTSCELMIRVGHVLRFDGCMHSLCGC